MASAFHAVRILSSRPGRTRAARAANSLSRADREARVGHRRRHAQAHGDVDQRQHDAQVPRAPFEIRRTVEAVVRRRHRPLVGAEQRAHLVRRPHVELAFLAVAVGVEARPERAVGCAHLARHPADDALRHREQRRIGGARGEARIQAEQLRVVGEHLLEMRDRPFGIDAVAAESAAELVVDAAGRHVRERDLKHVARLGVAARGEAVEHQLELGRMRELGRAAEAAMHRIEALRVARPRQHRWRSPAVPRPPRGSSFCIHSRRRAFCPAIESPCSRHACATRPSSSRKPGRPYAAWRGKYVPPKNGVPSGARNSVSGQPPVCCVSSACARW